MTYLKKSRNRTNVWYRCRKGFTLTELLCIAAVALLFAVQPRCAENLLPNGGFEIDKDSNGIPDGWANRGSTAGSKVTYSVDTKIFHSGAKSIKMVFDPSRAQVDEGYMVLRDTKMEFFETGRKYRLIGYVRGKGFNGRGMLEVKFLDKNNTPLGRASDMTSLSGDTKWIRLETEFEVPSRTTQVQVYTDTSGGADGGEVWWDSLWMSDITAEKERPYVEKSIETFEDENSIKLWRPGGAKISRTEECASEGKASLKIDFPGSSSDTWPGVTKPLFFDKAEFNWTKYDFFAFDVYNPASSSVFIWLRLDDANGKSFFVSFECAAGVWTKVKLKTASISNIDPTKVEKVYFYMRMPRNDATLFLDNVRFLTFVNPAVD